MERHFEDFTVGQRIETGTRTLDAVEIETFGRMYDPQDMHLPERAHESIFGKLIASGWQTASVAMRLLVDAGVVTNRGGVGLGVDELRWRKPVFAGDTLRVVAELESARPSSSRPSAVLRWKVSTLNQHDEEVMSHSATVIVPLRAKS